MRGLVYAVSNPVVGVFSRTHTNIRQEVQIVRLENRDAHPAQKPIELFDGAKPSINGFYALKKEPPFLDAPTHGAVMIAVV